jgi:hypothetical protein
LGDGDLWLTDQPPYAAAMAAGSDLRFLRVGDIELAYTTMGERDRPPVLLVAGLGAQLISWEDGFCDQLVDRRPVPREAVLDCSGADRGAAAGRSADAGRPRCRRPAHGA